MGLKKGQNPVAVLEKFFKVVIIFKFGHLSKVLNFCNSL